MGRTGGDSHAWDSDQIALLKELWPTKEGIRRLCCRVGHDKEHVLKKAAALGLGNRYHVSNRKEDHYWPQHRKDRFRREWIKGTSVKRLAEMFEISPSTVKYQRQHLGLEPRRTHKAEAGKLIGATVYMHEATYQRIAARAMAESMAMSLWMLKVVEARLG